jgi:transcription antitermination factor NusG
MTLIVLPATIPWYALHVQPLREFRVREQLERAGMETYLPCYPRKGWRSIEIQSPLFPGYVFGRNSASEIYDLCRPTRWLLRILGDRFGPIAIPSDQIETLRAMVTWSKQVEVTPIDIWKGGEEVTVKRGPLQGCSGTVAYVKNKTRLIVSISMLGRAVSAEVDPADLVVTQPENPVAA